MRQKRKSQEKCNKLLTISQVEYYNKKKWELMPLPAYWNPEQAAYRIGERILQRRVEVGIRSPCCFMPINPSGYSAGVEDNYGAYCTNCYNVIEITSRPPDPK